MGAGAFFACSPSEQTDRRKKVTDPFMIKVIPGSRSRLALIGHVIDGQNGPRKRDVARYGNEVGHTFVVAGDFGQI